ncbi:MAG: hypothetical protein LBK53_00075 [Heliobacteriaceae bacterium]|nr:hypothetical protein [Heliobacteriaceae bacterium]
MFQDPAHDKYTIGSISLQHLSICTEKKILQKSYIFIGGQILKQVQDDVGREDEAIRSKIIAVSTLGKKAYYVNFCIVLLDNTQNGCYILAKMLKG